ncbi:hypothetical protein RA2_02025 [Roseovarius sp. A-2]|uniref:hypothetical protein n=1 Tax=Roseovarius sp. A-2 TaxID=1570360 RepID=UPI0009C49E9F|nr:hypothetical protein [Roseovarius sp. A-2]GAW34968.1 hypothetical protein RA2_02025 [Roseovarius sp. A-2]
MQRAVRPGCKSPQLRRIGGYVLREAQMDLPGKTVLADKFEQPRMAHGRGQIGGHGVGHGFVFHSAPDQDDPPMLTGD